MPPSHTTPKTKMNATPTTSSIECDCPFCPLVALDTNICDLQVFLPETGRPRIVFPDDLIETITWNAKGDEELREKMYRFYTNTFHVITLIFRNTMMIRKKGQEGNYGGDDYNCVFEVIKPNHYKICFHTHRKKVADMD